VSSTWSFVRKPVTVHVDGNGNVTALVNASNGATAAVYEYSPFGELLRNEVFDTAIGDNPFRFSTKFYDTETGLINYGARYYSPALGRFINRDPIEEAGGVNLYGFCGNDPVGRFDPNGNSWLSSLWDRTIGSLGKHIAQNWDDGGRTYVEAAGIIAASVFVGAELAGAMSGVLSGTSMMVAADGTVTVTATSGAFAADLGAISGVAGGIAGGAAGGFVGGAASAAVDGGNMSEVLHAGGDAALIGGVLSGVSAGVFSAQPQMNGWSDMEHQMIAAGFRDVIGGLSQRYLGINGWRLDAYMEGVSFLGYALFGNPYHQMEEHSNQWYDDNGSDLDDDSEEPYIGGYGDRDPSTGLLFQNNQLAHYVGEFAFDTNDQLLQWQGLPDAGGLIAMASHALGDIQLGHSLGASRYANLASFGALSGGQVAALPFGMVAPTGVEAFIGNGDAVTGFSFGRLFNPGGTVFHVPFIAGHGLEYYMPGMGQ